MEPAMSRNGAVGKLCADMTQPWQDKAVWPLSAFGGCQISGC